MSHRDLIACDEFRVAQRGLKMFGKRKRKLEAISWISVVLVLLGAEVSNQISNFGYCHAAENKAITGMEDIRSEQIDAKMYITRADTLAEKMNVESLEKAIKEYKLALEIDPDNYEALWKIAYAYIGILDIKTNYMIVEKKEYRPILKELGEAAQVYAKKAYKINPKGKEAVRANLQSYGYYSASLGIVSAIFKGAAGHYISLAKELIAIDNTYWGASGYRCLGRLYYMAPWPVGSSTKALTFYQKAVRKSPKMLEPHYWLGMTYLDRKKYELAKKEFEFVLNNPPMQLEKHLISEFKKESKKQLNKIREINP